MSLEAKYNCTVIAVVLFAFATVGLLAYLSGTEDARLAAAKARGAALAEAECGRAVSE